MFNKVGIAWAGKAACGFIPKMKSKFFTSQRKMFLIFVGSISLRKGNWLMKYGTSTGFRSCFLSSTVACLAHLMMLLLS
jgi:hypothetical protein